MVILRKSLKSLKLSFLKIIADGKYLSFTSNDDDGDDKISISVKEVLDDGSTQNVPAGNATTVTGGTYTIGKQFTLEISNLEQEYDTAIGNDYLNYSR